MPHIDYYFGTGSAWAYLAGTRLEDIAARHGAAITYKPLDLMQLFDRTGGIRPAEEVCKFIEGWTASPLPILLTKGHTYNTMLALQELIAPIEPGNVRKINTVLGLFEQHVNGKEIASRIVSKRSARITPMMFEFELIERAKANRMRIVLAEGTEERILQATDILLRRDVAHITLLGDVDEIRAKAKILGLDIDKAALIDPINSEKFEEYVNTYYELRKKKGITPEQAEQMRAALIASGGAG